MKIIKKLIILFILIFLVSIFNIQISNASYAEIEEATKLTRLPNEYTEDQIKVQKLTTLDIDTNSYKPGDINNANSLKKIGNIIIGVVQFVGSFVSVIMIAVIGIKYMLGSVEEKAEYKKTMVPYIIGAVMVFGITNILGIVSEIAKNF